MPFHPSMVRDKILAIYLFEPRENKDGKLLPTQRARVTNPQIKPRQLVAAMSAAKVQQDPEAGKGASKHADDSDGIESTFRRRGGGISAEQVQSIVRGEIQALVKAGVLTLTGPMPESLLPAIEASAPEPVTAVAVGATAALGQTKKLVPQHNMPKLLGLPDFLEALDMPSEMLDHMIKDSIKSWELTGEVDQRVKDFATVFMRHHRKFSSPKEPSLNTLCRVSTSLTR